MVRFWNGSHFRWVSVRNLMVCRCEGWTKIQKKTYYTKINLHSRLDSISCLFLVFFWYLDIDSHRDFIPILLNDGCCFFIIKTLKKLFYIVIVALLILLELFDQFPNKIQHPKHLYGERLPAFPHQSSINQFQVLLLVHT